MQDRTLPALVRAPVQLHLLLVSVKVLWQKNFDRVACFDIARQSEALCAGAPGGSDALVNTLLSTDSQLCLRNFKDSIELADGGQFHELFSVGCCESRDMLR